MSVEVNFKHLIWSYAGTDLYDDSFKHDWVHLLIDGAHMFADVHNVVVHREEPATETEISDEHHNAMSRIVPV